MAQLFRIYLLALLLLSVIATEVVGGGDGCGGGGYALKNPGGVLVFASFIEAGGHEVSDCSPLVYCGNSELCTEVPGGIGEDCIKRFWNECILNYTDNLEPCSTTCIGNGTLTR